MQVAPGPVLALRGDRARDETARVTIGGGMVVNPFTDRHRTHGAELIERLWRRTAISRSRRGRLALVPDFACERAAMAQAPAATPTRSRVRSPASPTTKASSWRSTRRRPRQDDAREMGAFRGGTIALVAAAHATRPTDPASRWAPALAARRRRVVERSAGASIDSAGRSGSSATTASCACRRIVASTTAPALGARRAMLDQTVLRRPTPPTRGGDGTERRSIEGSACSRRRPRRRVAPDLYFAREATDAASARTEHCRAHGEISAGVFDVASASEARSPF
jgi:hypothetical protein